MRIKDRLYWHILCNYAMANLFNIFSLPHEKRRIETTETSKVRCKILNIKNLKRIKI